MVAFYLRGVYLTGGVLMHLKSSCVYVKSHNQIKMPFAANAIVTIAGLQRSTKSKPPAHERPDLVNGPECA